MTTALFLSRKEKELVHNALNVYAVDIMRQINDSYIRFDKEEGEKIREKLYDMMDDIEELMDNRFPLEV